MTKILPFPKRPDKQPSAEADAPSYAFTGAELTELYRWYSAMRYAFPQSQAVMVTCPKDRVSAVGLYGRGGTSPNCLISKHEVNGRILLLWATEQDPPRVITAISEITGAQISAIAPPRNEASWLDSEGWLKLLASSGTSTASGRIHSLHPAR